MKILLTGGTGLVGAHTALSLLRAGHELVLLVRDQRRARAWFARFGFGNVSCCVADMRDSRALAEALQGCDAVVHAAAVVDLQAARAEQTLRDNLQGLEAVVAQALAQGVAKILYVSSLAVLMGRGCQRLDEHSPLSDSSDAYSRAKLACERRVRHWQQQGAPIVTSYPAAVIGPDDPKLSESNAALRLFIRQFLPLTSSGLQLVDVRDLAEAHRALLEAELPGQPSEWRFIVGGQFLPWPRLHQLLRRHCGLKPLALPVPGWLLRGLASLLDGLRRFVSIDFPLSRESARLATQFVAADSSRLVRVTGCGFRPAEQTLSDTVAWLAESGHLTSHPCCNNASNNNTVEKNHAR